MSTQDLTAIGLGPISKSIVSDRSMQRDTADNILDDNPQRWVSLPIYFHGIWDAYKMHESHFWTAEDVDVAELKSDLAQLSDPIRHSFLELLSNDCATVFGQDDKENYKGVSLLKFDKCAASSALTHDIQVAEARSFYGFQASYENILLELHSIALLAAVGEDENKFISLVNAASKKELGIKRAALWFRHVWPDYEVSEDAKGPTAQERVVADGVLKIVQTLGHRLLDLIIRQCCPELVSSSITTVMRHTIETGMRHFEFSIMLHKSFSISLSAQACGDLIECIVDTELSFLEEVILGELFEGKLKPFIADFRANEIKSIKSAFGFDGDRSGTPVTSALMTSIGDGIVFTHPYANVQGDTMVEFEDDHAKVQENLVGDGMYKVVDNTQFNVDDDSDF